MSTQGGLSIVTDGLVFEVDAANKLGGNVSNTKNLKNPSQTGTFVNGASVVDGVYDFDGVDDYIVFGNNTVYDSADSTFEIWIKPTVKPLSGSGNHHNLFSRANTTISNNIKVQISILSDSRFIIQSVDLALNRIWESTFNGDFGQRQNYVVTKEPGTVGNLYNLKVYKNGVLDTGLFLLVNTAPVGTDQWTNNISNLNNLTVGAGITTLQENFAKGSFSNIKIYNRALTATEIKQNYEALKHNLE